MARFRDGFWASSIFAALGVIAAPAHAQIAPVYFNTFNDAVTGDNAFTGTDGKRHWTIDIGADNYNTDVYERPTAQTYKVFTQSGVGQQFATDGLYYGYLDIVQAKAGFDSKYLYISIELFSKAEQSSTPGHSDSKGLIERYGFRIGTNTTANRGSAGGMLLTIDNPANKTSPTSFNGDKAFGYRDVNSDVGGTSLLSTKQTTPSEVNGNGYESQIISDGKANNGSGPTVLYSRINPTNDRIVELAFDYAYYGFTQAQLQTLPYFVVEAAKGGTKDPQNYVWNDQYTQNEAGSPYRATSGDTSKSIYGTQGLGNIYEVDTLMGGGIGASSIGNYVWHDVNANGIQEPGEVGIAGVTVQLRDSANTLLKTTTTDGSGYYSFAGLTAGNYKLQFLTPGAYDAFTLAGQGGNTALDSDPNSLTGITSTFSLAVNQHDNTRDAGFFKYATLADFVWNDVNQNGVQDDGEAGIADVTVSLYDGNGNFIRSVLTDSDGEYRFSNLTPGDYRLLFEQLSGYNFSPVNAGGDPLRDSDAGDLGLSGIFTLSSGESDFSGDAGLYSQPINITVVPSPQALFAGLFPFAYMLLRRRSLHQLVRD